MIYWAGLLFSTFGLYFASRFIMCMSLADCWCLFWVLIQSSATLWWTGLYKKNIHIYVSFMLLLQRCVWKLLLLWRKSLNFCLFLFSSCQKVLFFKGWDYSAAYFVVDSKLKPYLYEWILKVTCKFVCFFSRLNCEDPQRKWMINLKKTNTKNPTYYYKSATLQMASTVLLSGRKQASLCFCEVQ